MGKGSYKPPHRTWETEPVEEVMDVETSRPTTRAGHTVTGADGVVMEFPDTGERVSIRREGNQLHITRLKPRPILIRPTGAINTVILELADS